MRVVVIFGEKFWRIAVSDVNEGTYRHKHYIIHRVGKFCPLQNTFCKCIYLILFLTKIIM